MPAAHIAIVQERVLAALRDGRKRVESRFSSTCRAPYGHVRPGDVVYFRGVGRPIQLAAIATRVVQMSELRPAHVRRIRRALGELIAAPAEYWRRKRNARFVVLIWLRPARLPAARPKARRQHGNAWVVLPRR